MTYAATQDKNSGPCGGIAANFGASPIETSGAVNAGSLKIAGTAVAAPPGTVITQTYSTASVTIAAATTHAITDSTGGSVSTTALAAQTLPGALTDNGGGAAADGTIGAITLTEPANLAAQTTINNQLADAIKELSTKHNLVNTQLTAIRNALATLAAEAVLSRADILARTQNINQVVDDLQVVGIEA